MKFILNIVSFLAVGGVAAASQQQEVEHRLRGGVPASTKNVEERRLGLADEDSNATSSSTSSDGVGTYIYNDTTMNATSSSTSSDMEDTSDTTTAAASASSGDCASITETVCAMEGVTVFCELLQNPKRRHLGLSDTNSTSTDEEADAVAMSSPTGASASSADSTEDFASAFGFEDESEEFTLFVPTDAAFAEIADKFETLSDAEAGRVIMFHMYSGMLLTSDKLACSETITSMNEMSDASRTKCKNDGKKYQNGNGNTKTGSMPEIDTADHMACNGVIHTLDHVMFPVSLSQLHADDAAASSDPTTTGESTDTSSDADEIDYMACPVDKHGCYCCATEYEYPAGAASCRTDHKERYCCGAEDQCSEEAVHPTSNSGALRTLKEGDYVLDDASKCRFPFQIIGESWTEVFDNDERPTLDVIVKNDDETYPKKWIEGPLWMPSDKAFYFNTPIEGNLWKVSEKFGGLQLWATQAGGINPEDYPTVAEPGSNGMVYDPNDPTMVYICQQGSKRVVRCRLSKHTPGRPLEECPDFEIMAEFTPDGRRFNSPNDIVIDDDGYVWFTDPIYGFLEKDRDGDIFDPVNNNNGGSYLDAASNEIGAGKKGVYRLNTKKKDDLVLFSDYHRRPNGLAIYNNTSSPPSLWVADSTIGMPSWTKYDISNTKTTTKALEVITPAVLGTVLGQTSDSSISLVGNEGLSDGFKIDNNTGILWSTIPNGYACIDISVPYKPRLLCQILTGINTANIQFGDGNDVYLTGKEGVWRMKKKRQSSKNLASPP